MLFVPEYVVPYSDELMNAKIPVDEGVDVWINLDNYSYVQCWGISNEEGSMDVYLTVMQTNFTRLFEDGDKSDNLWRVGKAGISGWCAQSGRFTPFSGEKNVVKNIYYLVMHPDEVQYMTEEISFEDYEKHLIWTQPDVPGE